VKIAGVFARLRRFWIGEAASTQAAEDGFPTRLRYLGSCFFSLSFGTIFCTSPDWLTAAPTLARALGLAGKNKIKIPGEVSCPGQLWLAVEILRRSQG